MRGDFFGKFLAGSKKEVPRPHCGVENAESKNPIIVAAAKFIGCRLGGLARSLAEAAASCRSTSSTSRFNWSETSHRAGQRVIDDYGDDMVGRVIASRCAALAFPGLEIDSPLG